jgi:polyribonucleotide nucleotidyltransferase
MKIIDQATGQEIPRAEGEADPEAEFRAERPPRREREGGGGGRDRRPRRDAG